MLKFLNISLLFVVSNFFVVGSTAFAALNKVVEKVLVLPEQKGQVLVRTEKTSEVLGRPYRIELRVVCSKEKVKSWDQMEVVDSEAVCDVKSQSAKMTADGRHISILIRETDAESFNEQSKKVKAAVIGEIQPQCQKRAKIFLFSVEKFCQK